MQCVEVDLHRIRSRNAVERSLSQIEVIRSLTRGEGTRYNVILYVMGVVGEIQVKMTLERSKWHQRDQI
jgi:hypothetical protein